MNQSLKSTPASQWERLFFFFYCAVKVRGLSHSVNDTSEAKLPLSVVVRGATMLAFAYIRLSQRGCLHRDNEAAVTLDTCEGKRQPANRSPI